MLLRQISAIGGRFDQAFILQQGLGVMSFQFVLAWGGRIVLEKRAMNSTYPWNMHRTANTMRPYQTYSYPQSVPLLIFGSKRAPQPCQETQRFVQSFFTVHKAVEGPDPCRIEEVPKPTTC